MYPFVYCRYLSNNTWLRHNERNVMPKKTKQKIHNQQTYLDVNKQLTVSLLFPVIPISQFLKIPSSSTQNLTVLKRWPGLSTPRKSNCTSTLASSPVSETTTGPPKSPSGSSWCLTCITSMSYSSRSPPSHTAPLHRTTPLILTLSACPKVGLQAVHVTRVHKEEPHSPRSLL